MNKYKLGRVEVEIKCPYCDENFLTYQWIFDGDIDHYCCSEECYNYYHSKEKVRERKLNEILNEI